MISSLQKMNDKATSFFCDEKRKNGLWFCTILSIFSGIFLLNMLTPMIADDYAYQLVFGTKDYVEGIVDIIHSQTNHYYLWGGRSVVHFIAQILLFLPPLVADVLNSLVFLLFLYLIYWHIKGRGKGSLSLFVLISLAIWFFIPMFGDTVLWMTGSANYLWGTTILLLFLLPYRLFKGNLSSKLSRQIVCGGLFLIGGIIAGWTNENTVAGLIAIIVLLFFYYRSQGWKIPITYIVGLLGVFIGYAIMITAPGNFRRGGEALELGVSTIFFRIFSYTQTLFLDYGYLLLIFAVLLLLVYKTSINVEQREKIYLAMIYMLGSLVSIYAMILSPQFPERAWFGLITFMLISLGMLFNALLVRKELFNSIKHILMLISLIIFFFSYLSAYKDVYRMYRIDKERVIQVKDAKIRGDKECVFYMNRPQTKYLHAEDINGNHLLVHHYGIHIEYK